MKILLAEPAGHHQEPETTEDRQCEGRGFGHSSYDLSAIDAVTLG